MNKERTREHSLVTGAKNRRLLHWLTDPLFVLAAIVFACLVPFINKAVHIDDPLFVWSAKWIQHHPTDFYGFAVNWFGSPQTMAEVNNNPPLASFYLAAVGSIFGWSEPALHAGLLMAAVAAAWGLYLLSRAFCIHPLIASCAGILSPAFLLSSSTLMCDTLMLAFWIWALICWRVGLNRNRGRWFGLGAALAALAWLTKFSAIMLVPLLLLQTLLHYRKLTLHLLWLSIPIATLAAYECCTNYLYGRGLFQTALLYTGTVKPLGTEGLLDRLLTGLCFTGGSLLTIAAFGPFLGKKWLALAGLSFAIALLYLSYRSRIGSFLLTDGPVRRWDLILQAALFCTAALLIFAFTTAQLWRRRDPEAIFLACWIAGVFLFAAVVNWTINARSLLPMIPAAAIVLGRQLNSVAHLSFRGLTLVAGGALSLTALWADSCWANGTRALARQLCADHAQSQGTLFFDGHWGFQYYMEQGGAHSLDHASSIVSTNDQLVFPSKNSTGTALAPEFFRQLEQRQIPPGPFLATMSTRLCAGFYSDLFGKLPFSIGKDDPALVYVLAPIQNLAFPLELSNSNQGPPADPTLLAAYRELAARNPQSPEAQFQLAAFLMDHGADSEAEMCLAETIRLNPAHAQAHERLGLLLDRRGQIERALAEYRHALSLNPALPTALNNLAWRLATRASNAKSARIAVELAKRACSLTGRKKPVFLGTLAAAYAAAGDFSRAVATAEEAARLAKDLHQDHLAAKNLELLDLYRAGKAYQE